MGYIAHDAVIVTVAGYINDDREADPRPKVAAFRESLPETWRQLIVGPVRSVMNGYDTYAFLPDGSKEGWEDSDRGDEYRRQFVEIFSFKYEDGSTPFDVAAVRYGGDYDGEFDGPSAMDPRTVTDSMERRQR